MYSCNVCECLHYISLLNKIAVVEFFFYFLHSPSRKFTFAPYLSTIYGCRHPMQTSFCLLYIHSNVSHQPLTVTDLLHSILAISSRQNILPISPIRTQTHRSSRSDSELNAERFESGRGEKKQITFFVMTYRT